MTRQAGGVGTTRVLTGVANAFEPAASAVIEPLDSRRDEPSTIPRMIPGATVARLAVYLRVLISRPTCVGDVVSSTELAAAAGVKPAGLRKDLSFLGSYGTRGVGYDVATLTDQIRIALGAHHAYRVALVGLGNLGQALAGYGGFAGRGFEIAALFDNDPGKVGRVIGGKTVHPMADAARVCAAESITIGIIATPESVAQEVADVLVGTGVRSILNFAPGVLVVPDGVELRRVDLALELQILAFHETQRSSAGQAGHTAL